MGYKEKVLKQLKSEGHRVVERQELWQIISDSFEKDGADSVAEELEERMEAIQKEFDDVLAKLEDML